MGKPVNKTLRIAAMSAGEEIGHVSGPIVTFRGNGAPLRSLLVNIDPVQDLHGYDNPWPAGGGKNLADFVNDESLDFITGKPIPFDGRIATINPIAIENGKSYVFYILGGQDKLGIYSVFNGDTLVRRVTGVASGTTIDTSDGDSLYVCVYSNVTVDDAKAMVCLSTVTDTTYAPYSNICPISGWDGMTVYHSGADTSDPTTYPITWQSAGTVYGGTLDVTNGVLVVDRTCQLLDGTEAWAMPATSYFALPKPNLVNDNSKATIICDRFKGDSWQRITGLSLDNVVGVVNGATIRIHYSAITSVENWKTWLASNNTAICYELATPITIQLTPTEITTLLGQNNVWADSGDVDVEYIATGGEGGKLALLLRNRKELLIAMRKGLSPAEVGLLGSIPSFGGSFSPGVIRPGLNTQEEEDEKYDA